MKSYFKNIVYYFLECVSNICNLGCSLFRLYPTFDFGISYLCALEVRRMKMDIEEHIQSKNEILAEADKMKAKAHDQS